MKIALGSFIVFIILLFAIYTYESSESNVEIVKSQLPQIDYNDVEHLIKNFENILEPDLKDDSNEIITRLINGVLSGPYGEMTIEEVLQAFRNIPGGPEIQEILRVLAVRKKEALPLIKERLRNGDWFEQHLLTKFLRYSPWPETIEELIELAQSTEAHWLAREGALYALGALANSDAGPAVVSLLNDPNSPPSVRLVSLATLGRIGYANAVLDIKSFLEHEELQFRIFANYALSELNAEYDIDFIIKALNHENRFVREEACNIIWREPNKYIEDKLYELKEKDAYAAVRASAERALVRREIQDLDDLEKLNILLLKLNEDTDKFTKVYILETILKECGSEGRHTLKILSTRDDYIGDRSKTLLLWNLYYFDI
jgi:hypothetical protein